MAVMLRWGSFRLLPIILEGGNFLSMKPCMMDWSYFGGSFFNKVSWKYRKNSWASCCSPIVMFPEMSVIPLYKMQIFMCIHCYTSEVFHQRCWVDHWWLPAVDILSLQGLESIDETLPLPPCPIWLRWYGSTYLWFYFGYYWLIQQCTVKLSIIYLSFMGSLSSHEGFTLVIYLFCHCQGQHITVHGTILTCWPLDLKTTPHITYPVSCSCIVLHCGVQGHNCIVDQDVGFQKSSGVYL